LYLACRAETNDSDCTMKYFLDTEFLDDRTAIDLISIAVVCEDGREYYACNDEVELERIYEDPWLSENVAPYLPAICGEQWKCRLAIAADLREFVSGETGSNEFWGYYPAYDWVALCQLYGKMIDIPRAFPKQCFDINQLRATIRLSDGGLAKKLPKPADARNALVDARWNRDFYNSIIGELESEQRAKLSR
jgi:3' exoribonuclease, RNase T-like